MGQFDAAKATKEVREIDSGRLINEPAAGLIRAAAICTVSIITGIS